MLKKKRITVVVLILIALSGVAFWVRFGKSNETTSEIQKNIPCTDQQFVDSLWGGAVFLTREDRISELKAIVEKIKATDGYQTSADCLYVTARASLAFEPVEVAENEIKALRDAYDATGYRSAINTFALDPSILEAQLNLIKDANSKNSIDKAKINDSTNLIETTQ